MLKQIINKPICVKLEHEWQKGWALAQFENCDNNFRLDDKEFNYLHFRTLNNCTFYTDSKGASDTHREVYNFDEIFKLTT